MQASKKKIILFLSLIHRIAAAAAFDTPVTPDVSLGTNIHIESTARISGKSSIDDNSSVGHYSVLENVTVGKSVKILSHCVLTNVTIEDGAVVGPFAHLHDGTIVKEKAVIGNFVEATRSIVGKNSKAKHLTYLGDTELGENVNIGAGTITCNYDGVNKSKTFIEDGAMIGSNNCLVAPITIGSGAMTGAGSTLTEDVPGDALAIARSKQIIKPSFASKLLQKFRSKKNANSLQSH